MRVLVIARLLECCPAVIVADGPVGAGLEQRLETFGVTEINRCGVHERRETEIVDRVDRRARFGKNRDDRRPIRNRGPMEQIDPGAFRDARACSCRDQGPDDVLVAERHRLAESLGQVLGVVGEQQLDVFHVAGH